MRKLLLFLFTIVSLDLASQSIDEKPSKTFNVNINGTIRKVKEDEAFKLEDKIIKINISPEMTFSKGIVSFDYPQYFAYEYNDEGNSLKSWVLSGNDFKIFYMIIKGNFSPSDYADSMKTKFEESIDTDATLSINKNTFEGRKLMVSVLRNPFDMEIYKLKFDGKNTHFLIFQDSKKENGNKSDESALAKEILNKTFYLH